MDGSKKRSGLDVATDLLSRHVEGVAERKISDTDKELSRKDLVSVSLAAQKLLDIEATRTKAVLRAMMLRHRTPAELKELLVLLQARDESTIFDEEGSAHDGN